jgi:NAD dependent epimerase/dehydratase family enzyme
LRPWRSLTHSLGFRIFYRVRLCLDGVLDHVWTPEIVERIIDSRCALQHIVTDLVQSVDTRHIEL